MTEVKTCDPVSDCVFSDGLVQFGTFRAYSPRGSVFIDIDGPPKTSLVTIQERGGVAKRAYVRDYNMPKIWALIKAYKTKT